VIRASGGGKTDLKKVGLNSVPDGVVKNNLMGISPTMQKKGWVDAQGRKGKVRYDLKLTGQQRRGVRGQWARPWQIQQ
jgi:hypothetical protein